MVTTAVGKDKPAPEMTTARVLPSRLLLRTVPWCEVAFGAVGTFWKTDSGCVSVVSSRAPHTPATSERNDVHVHP